MRDLPEAEALTGVAVALLTIYDMCKAVDKEMQISDIRLLENNRVLVSHADGYAEFDLATRTKVHEVRNPRFRKTETATRLPNGNTVLGANSNGVTFFEVTPSDEIVWRYVSPVSTAGPIVQASLSSSAPTFRVLRYGPDYPGLQGKDLTPGGVIELYPEAVAQGPAFGYESTDAGPYVVDLDGTASQRCDFVAKADALEGQTKRSNKNQPSSRHASIIGVHIATVKLGFTCLAPSLMI